MLQSYFLARDHFYICDKFAYGPMEKDEVYLCGYVSRLVRDEMAVTFLETCVPISIVDTKNSHFYYVLVSALYFHKTKSHKCKAL